MSGKFLVNLSFDIVSDDDVKDLSANLSEALKTFAGDKYLFVSQMSVYQQKDPISGKPLNVDDDGNPSIEKFEIKNLVTDVL